MQTVGIIGGGILGKAIARGFTEHAEVKVFDVLPERSTVYSLADAATCDIVFIALPTPALPDGRCETLYIDDFLRTAYAEEYWRKDSCYCIRSTVPVGYTQNKFDEFMRSRPLFHSPEFLTARCSLVDFQLPARNIIGYPAIRPSEAVLDYKASFDSLEALYRLRFPDVPLLTMPTDASELVKLATNTFFAAKVSMFNLFQELAVAAGVDWHQVRGAIMADGRIAHAHTKVPGPDGVPGFGGTCLPKDTASLYHAGLQAGVNVELLRAILDRNELIRRPADKALATIELPGSGCGTAGHC